jgi:hypothetical protein
MESVGRQREGAGRKLGSAAMGDSGGAHWEKEPAAHASGNLRALNRRWPACFVTKGPTGTDRSTASTSVGARTGGQL